MSERQFTGVVQIGIVVEDAEATAQRYQDLLGVDGWSVNQVDTEEGLGSNFRFRGSPLATKAKIVWANLGEVEIELIEPQDQSSIYAEFLRSRGPGVHHVMFGAADFDAAGRGLRNQGLSVLSEGRLQGGRFALYGTQSDLGLIVEIAEGEALIPDRALS